MKPNFLFIGPDKTGSSWLFEILRRHPECFVPSCKDIYFFDRYYDRGMEWYSSFFAEASEEIRVVGELSHDYLFSPAAAHRIYQDLPGVRIMTCLRNPVERTFSHYLYLIRSGRTRQSFEDALDAFPELVNNSLYYKHLSKYVRLFERSRIKVLFFNDLRSDPEAFARDVFAFLGISFVEGINYYSIVRPASRPRVFFLARMAKHGADIARNLGLTELVGIIKHSPLANILYKPYEKHDRPAMSSSSREKLKGIFHDDIRHLQDMLGVDLAHWLREAKE